MFIKRILPALLLTALITGSFSCIDDPPTHAEVSDFQSSVELVWELYDQKYVGFPDKSVDWDAVHAEYSQRAEGLSTTPETQALITEMIGELQDRSALVNDASSWLPEDYFENVDPDTLESILSAWNFIWDDTLSRYWGSCNIDSLHYINVRDFYFFFTAQALSENIQNNLDARGMILDLRISTGTSLVPAEQITGYFAEENMTAFLTRHRTGPDHDDLSPLEPHTVSPRTWAYTRPVVVLTGQQTIGPAEAFASAMGSMSHVTIIGDTTGGGGNTPGFFNQRNWVALPGIMVTCPFSTVLAADTSLIEGRGVPCDIYVHVTEGDILAGEDPVLDYAIDYLGSRS